MPSTATHTTMRAAITEAARIALSGEVLPPDLAEAAMAQMMAGEASPVQTAAFLTALASRPLVSQELAAMARAMRAAALQVEIPEALRARLVDTCGTGGDGSGTFNISTAVALVVAAAGVPVAKHGNRSATSKAGGADVLEALGVRIDLGPDEAVACLHEVGMVFLFAPRYHPAMKHVAPVRRELGFPTAFNLLGPLCNPLAPPHQVVGVYEPTLVPLVAGALAELGTSRAMVVSGEGLDELSLAGENLVGEVGGRTWTTRRLSARELGLTEALVGALAGGDAVHNAGMIEALLEGEVAPPVADVVCLNAAAALTVAGRSADLAQGLALARELLASGAARETLESLRRWRP